MSHLGLALALTLFLAVSIDTVSAAEDSEAAQQELAAVSTAIEEIQAWIVEAKSTQSRETENLERAELEISELIQSVGAIEAQIEASQAEISTLALQAERLNEQKSAQGEILEQTIRAAYMSGTQSAIELLLNQDDISESSRMLYYHRLFTEAQLESIGAFQETLDEIQTLNRLQESKATELAAEQTRLEADLASLSQSQQRREAALSQLRLDIANRSGELEQLEIDQLQLQELIEEIERAVADIPEAMRRSPFGAQRGRLSLPVAGQITQRFGSRYGEGDLRRQGITIAVSEGTPVQAVHPGRVVFSDWLRGTGLLVIIDHGEGYMSLYGANQALSKQAGDWVNAGDIISTSGLGNELLRGQGGDQARPGVYFEIRHHGTAQNPADWLAD